MGTTYIKRSPAHAAQGQSIRIANSQSIAIGEYVIRDTAGDLRAAADTLNFIPLGILLGLSDKTSNAGTTTVGSDTGDTAATPPPEGVVNLEGGVYESIAVTGAASQADVGRPVYVTGGNTYTLTETTHLPAVGVIARWRTGTTSDILFFSAESMAAAKHAGDRKRNVSLGIVSTLALRGTTAKDLAKITMRGWGKITRVWAKPGGYHLGHNTGSQNVNLEIGTTNLTGGVLALKYTSIDVSSDLANNVSATAVTAANEFNDGDIITLEQATGGKAYTATAPINWEIWADVTYYGSDV